MRDFFEIIFVIIVSIFNSFRSLLPLFSFILSILFIIALVILLIVLFLTIIIFVIVSIITKKSYLKLHKKCLSGDYDIVISKGIKLIKWYKIISKILPFPSIKKILDNLNIFLAISFLAKNNNEKFISHIEAIKYKTNLKEQWYTIYYLMQKDVTTASEHYKKLLETKDVQEDAIYFIDSMFLYESGETEKAKQKMEKVYSTLNYKFTKEIAEKIINQN